nr:SDR family NAD(P)-dependent oxidoreductase [Bradyrhizobium sp. 6(2017)]
MARVALVTGGSREIGAAIARALAAAGCRVAACYARNVGAAWSFQDQTGIPVFQWDLANYEPVQPVSARWRRRWAQSTSWSTTPVSCATSHCIE